MGKRTINPKEDERGNARKLSARVKAVLVAVVPAAVVAGVVIAAVLFSRNQCVPEMTVSGTAPGNIPSGALEIIRAQIYDETIPESRTEQLLKNAGGMTVHLKTASSFGSGVIFDVTEDFLYVVTAAHVLPENVVPENGAVTVTFCDGEEVCGTLAGRSGDADIAFLRIPLTELKEDRTDPYRYAVVNKESYDALAGWDTVLCMGVMADAQLAVYEGYLLDNWIYVEDFAQYMMLAKCQVYPGMSGGGLYDGQGYLIGIVCGGNDEGELAAVPLHVVQAQFYMLEPGKME